MNKQLILVDGSSYLYRAYHALPDLRNALGEPTGAILGFLNMFHRLEKDYPTAYVACIFDARGKTFRHDLYEQYKANRPHMPEDLSQQAGQIIEIVKMHGWPIIQVDGIEADDVIGTIAKKAESEGFSVIVSTGDKDLAQLVNQHVTLINTMTNEVMDTEGVRNKFGVEPNRMIDYLSLIGDTADNVPGVQKVGPKTAVKWLTQYGSLDEIMANAASIKGVVGENLRQALDWLPMAKDLVTIRTNCDLAGQFDSITDSLKKQKQDDNALREVYKRLGFNSLLREVNAHSQDDEASETKPAKPVSVSPQTSVVSQDVQGQFNAAQAYEMVLTEEQLDRWLDKINQSSLTAIDTETTSLDVMKAKLVGISLCVQSGEAAYIPLMHTDLQCAKQLPIETVLQKLKPWLTSKEHLKVGQNIKYDMHVFENYGMLLQGIVHDTLLESYVLASHRRHDMDSMSQRILGHTCISYESVCGKGSAQIGFDQVELEPATQYAAEDTDVTMQLHLAMWQHLNAQDKLRDIYERIEIPTMLVLQKMERNGVLIDSDKLFQQSQALGKQIFEIGEKVTAAAGQRFNINSPKQLGEILFTKLGLPVVKKTASGTPSTSEDVLEKLALDYPLPKLVLSYRSFSKLKSTYTDKLPQMINPRTGRVHTNYAQAVAVTGRLASNDPNLQNIPARTEEGRRIREAFIAPEGSYIVAADYSQIELRIMAHLSGDKGLCSAFANGLDVHRVTAGEIFNIDPSEVTSDQRRFAKVINFGLIYGMSAFGVAKNLDISRTDAQNYIERYFHRYPGVAAYMEETRLKAREQGYVETVLGRRLWLPEINSPNGPRRQAAERAAINAPMQGTAADIIKLAMVGVQKWLDEANLRTKLIMQVHDELVLEVPADEKDIVCSQISEIMNNVLKLDVPLITEVGCGKNWHEAH